MTTRGWFEATLQAAFTSFCRRLAEGRPASFQDFLHAADSYIAAEYGGMELEKYGAKLANHGSRMAAERQARVITLVEQGASPEEIAKAERITVRHARRLRGRLRSSGE
jgi:DNA-binding CsgD family transcriptional regulator